MEPVDEGGGEFREEIDARIVAILLGGRGHPVEEGDAVSGLQVAGLSDLESVVRDDEHRVTVRRPEHAVPRQLNLQHGAAKSSPEEMRDGFPARLSRLGVDGQGFHADGFDHLDVAQPLGPPLASGPLEEIGEGEDRVESGAPDSGRLGAGEAVAAQARARVERLEAERLGLGRLDHLPDVDAHAVVEHLQLVDQGDVDRAVGVLQDLARLGHLGRGDRHDLGRRPCRRGRRASSQAARRRGRRRPWGWSAAEKFGLPGSSRSGLKARKKSLPGLEARSPRGSGSTTSRVVPG